MLRAFSTAATGMTAQQMMVDVIANNLANMNTNGFKRSQIDFQDLLYLQMRDPGTEVASGINTPSGLEIGGGVHAAATIKVFTSGEFENTGRDLDMAIRGDGFLEVVLPNGDLRYTRDGALQTNANGELVTTTGYIVQTQTSYRSFCTGCQRESAYHSKTTSNARCTGRRHAETAIKCFPGIALSRTA